MVDNEKLLQKLIDFTSEKHPTEYGEMLRESIVSIPVEKRVSPTEPTFTQKQILDLVRKELTEAFSDDYTPDELKDKIYLVHGYIIGALRR